MENNTPLNNNEEFSSLMRIAEFSIKQFNERRNYSWKISLGFWGAIIGSIAVINQNYPNLNTHSCIIVLVGIVVIILHGYWLKSVFCADKKDKDLAWESRNKAIALIGIELIHIPNAKRKDDFFHDWSAIFQLSVTIILVFIVVSLQILAQCK